MIDRSLRPRGGHQILTGHFDIDRRYRHRRARGTDDWLIFATIDGAGFIATGETRILLPRGHLACYTPGTPQDYGTDHEAGTWEFLWAHVDPRPTWVAWLAWPEVAPGLRRLRIDDAPLLEAVLGNVHAMHHDSLSLLATGEELARNALERALLLAHLANPAAAEGTLDQRVRTALAYMGANLHRPLSLGAIAAHSDTSPSRLSHLFRDQVGMPPVRFHERQRLQRGAELLRATELSVGEIAAQVGFEDPFYFSNRFRRWAGCSPRQWRRSRDPEG